MKPTNQKILNEKYFSFPSPAEFREGLRQRNRQIMLSKMVNEEDERPNLRDMGFSERQHYYKLHNINPNE